MIIYIFVNICTTIIDEYFICILLAYNIYQSPSSRATAIHLMNHIIIIIFNYSTFTTQLLQQQLQRQNKIDNYLK